MTYNAEPTLCTWCEDRPAIRTWWDEHNGPTSICHECDADSEETQNDGD
jgi:hypothetical protein